MSERRTILSVPHVTNPTATVLEFWGDFLEEFDDEDAEAAEHMLRMANELRPTVRPWIEKLFGEAPEMAGVAAAGMTTVFTAATSDENGKTVNDQARMAAAILFILNWINAMGMESVAMIRERDGG